MEQLALFDMNWIDTIHSVLDDISKQEELPDNSLQFIENIGRVKQTVTSYSVAVLKPDFPKGINPNGTAKNTLINIKIAKMVNRKCQVSGHYLLDYISFFSSGFR